MGNLVHLGILILMAALGSLSFAEGPNKGARYCGGTQFQQCVKSHPDDPSVCGYQYQDCYYTDGGAILRSNGTSVQLFDPNNRDFQACKNSGSTQAIQSCINQRVQARSGGAQVSSAPTAVTDTPASDATAASSSTPDEGALQNQTVSSGSSACLEQMANLLNACRNETTSAVNSCDDKKDSGMSAVQTGALLLGQQTAASVQGACSNMAKLSQAANAAVAAYQINCSTSVDSCRSACHQAVDFWNSQQACVVNGIAPPENLYNDAKDSLNTCNDLSAKADQARQAIQNYALTAANAANCSNATSGTSAVTPEICKANPSLPGCTAAGTVDCTKPEMASNKVCICSKNPNSPSCLHMKSAAGGANASGTTDLSSLAKNSGALDGAGDINGLPLPEQAKVDPSLGGTTVDGNQGGRANLSGSSDGSGTQSGHDGNGGGKSGAGNSIEYGGLYGGGHGGFVGRGGYNGEGGKAEAGGLLDRFGSAVKQGATDLRKFLPGGQMDPRLRGIAGASGPDGITGPHSDIWQKIQNRYRVLGPSLMP